MCFDLVRNIPLVTPLCYIYACMFGCSSKKIAITSSNNMGTHVWACGGRSLLTKQIHLMGRYFVK